MLLLDPCYCSTDIQILLSDRRRGCELIKSGLYWKNNSKICFANFELVTALCAVDSTHIYVKIFMVKPFAIVLNVQLNIS